MRAGLIIETVTHLTLALTRTPVVALGIFFVFGAHAFVWGTTATTIRQRAVPDELFGRVSGVYRVGIFGGLVAGAPDRWLPRPGVRHHRARSGSGSSARRSWSRSCGASSATSPTTRSRRWRPDAPRDPPRSAVKLRAQRPIAPEDRP